MGAALRRHAHLPDHVLEVSARRADEQHAAARIPNGVLVRDVPRPEQVVARARLDGGVADLERRAALEDPERLVLAMVDVQGSVGAGRLGHLHDRHLSAGVGAGGLDHASAANHQRASPSSLRTAVACSACSVMAFLLRGVAGASQRTPAQSRCLLRAFRPPGDVGWARQPPAPSPQPALGR